MKILGVIPARFASTRFPEKALVKIGGKPMVQHVYEQASKSKNLNKVIVATDHQRIFDTVKDFGGEVQMTSVHHQSGTDRCAQVLASLAGFDYVVNIQGDEPFIDPLQIDLVCTTLDGTTELATLAKEIKDEESLFSPNVVKLIFGKDNNAIYFSRHPLPYLRNYNKEEWLNKHRFYKHIGMYAYRADILHAITKLPPSALELAESLEQLRWLENGFKVKVSITEMDSIGIDTPEDLEKALKYIGKKEATK